MITWTQTHACPSLNDSEISSQTTFILFYLLLLFICPLCGKHHWPVWWSETKHIRKCLTSLLFFPEYFTPHLGEYVNVLSALEKLNVAILKAMDKTKEVGDDGVYLCMAFTVLNSVQPSHCNTTPVQYYFLLKLSEHL